jgi:hypothetical protein
MEDISERTQSFCSSVKPVAAMTGDETLLRQYGLYERQISDIRRTIN